MSNGEDDPTGGGPKDGKPKGAGKASGRKRRAARPPTVDGRAKEVSAQEDAATEEALPESTTPETAASGDASSEASAETEAPAQETSPDSSVDAPVEAAPDSGAHDSANSETTSEPADATASLASEESSGDTESDEREDGCEPEAELAATETQESHPPIPTARRASLIGAGLVGALIALAAYLGLYYGGILPRDLGTTTDALQTQAQDLGRRIATLESGAARDAKRDLAKDVSQLQSAVEELGSDPKNALVKRVRQLESSVGTLAGSAGDGNGNGVASLESRLSALEDSVSKAGETVSGDAQAQLSDIVKRVESLELRPAATTEDGTPVDTSAPIAALSDRISALDKQMQAMTKQVADLSKAGDASTQQTLTTLKSDLTAMQSELDKLGGTIAQSTSSVDDKLAAFQKSLADRDTGNIREVARTTAGALALTSLVKSADSGAPYAAELDVLRPLLDDKADLAVLDEYAKTGAPDVQTLASQFGAVSSRILTADDPSESGLVDTLLTSAKSLVRVRPVGKVEGDGRGAIVARIEAALQAGDLQTAESEWTSLDAAAQDASKSWADGLKARIAVNTALAKLSESLTASLTGEAAAKASGAADAGKSDAKPANSKNDASTDAKSGGASPDKTQPATN